MCLLLVVQGRLFLLCPSFVVVLVVSLLHHVTGLFLSCVHLFSVENLDFGVSTSHYNVLSLVPCIREPSILLSFQSFVFFTVSAL